MNEIHITSCLLGCVVLLGSLLEIASDKSDGVSFRNIDRGRVRTVWVKIPCSPPI